MAEEKILVVDDEKKMRDLLSKVLNEKGYSVSVAEDGAQGIKMAKKDRPDLVLLDLKMPGEIDGIEVLRRIKALDKGIQVVIITAYGSPESRIEEIRFGAFGEIGKPFKIENIESIVSEALET